MGMNRFSVCIIVYLIIEYVLTADEVGLFAADDTGNLFSYDQQSGGVLVSQSVGLSGTALALAATSPGTQRLPERMFA